MEGVLVEVRGESMNGAKKWLVHQDNMPLLQRAGEGEIRPARTTFLSPFDSFFWAQNRNQKLWGFNHLLEFYKPREERVYGYYCLPILHNDLLVGRFDPRLDHQSGVMQVNALYLEPGIEQDEELVTNVTAVMRDFSVMARDEKHRDRTVRSAFIWPEVDARSQGISTSGRHQFFDE